MLSKFFKKWFLIIYLSLVEYCSNFLPFDSFRDLIEYIEERITELYDISEVEADEKSEEFFTIKKKKKAVLLEFYEDLCSKFSSV